MGVLGGAGEHFCGQYLLGCRVGSADLTIPRRHTDPQCKNLKSGHILTLAGTQLTDGEANLCVSHTHPKQLPAVQGPPRRAD